MSVLYEPTPQPQPSPLRGSSLPSIWRLPRLMLLIQIIEHLETEPRPLRCTLSVPVNKNSTQTNQFSFAVLSGYRLHEQYYQGID